MNNLRRSQYRTKRKQRAITLLELLFSIMLLALGGTMIAATTPTATTSRMKAEEMNRAMGLAQKELESIKGLGYVNVDATQLTGYGLLDSATPISGTTYSFTNVDNASLDSCGQILKNGTGTVLIEQVETDVRRVTVTVSWRERGVANRSVTVGGIIANL